MLRLIASILAFLAGVYCASAEPSPSVRKLMSEPVSLFSYGLIRLAGQIREDFSPKRYRSFVGYEWDTNRILVRLFKDVDAPPQDEELRELCRLAIGDLREWGYVRDGKPLVMDTSRYTVFFEPYGYSLDRLDGTGPEVDKLVVLSLYLVHGNENAGRCSAPLLGTTFDVASE